MTPGEYIQLKVGDRFRVLEGRRQEQKCRYVVIEVWDNGSVVAYDENELARGNTESPTVHFFGRKPLEALFSGRDIKIAKEPSAVADELKQFLARTEAALEFVPEGEAVAYDTGSRGLEFA